MNYLINLAISQKFQYVPSQRGKNILKMGFQYDSI